MPRLLVVLVVATIVALVGTVESVHIGPNVGALVAAVGLVVAALAVPPRWRRPAAIAAAIAAGFAAEHVLLRPGMPQVHDVDHLWGLWAYARAVRSGHLLPMWIPWIGVGMPLLQFYGPLTFLLSIPAIVLGLAPVGIWKVAVAQASVLAALAALWGARLLGASWRAALVAAVALAVAPWKLTVFHYRGALGEATAFAWTTLVAAAVLASLRATSRRTLGTLAFAVALLMTTHLISMFCLGIVLVAVLLVEIAADHSVLNPRALRNVALAGLLGAAVAAVWWVPALTRAKATSLELQTEMNRYFVYDQHGVTAYDLLERREWDRMRISLLAASRARGAEGLQMPFYAGWILFGAALTSPWWSGSRRTWGPAAGAALSLALATRPVASAMANLPLIPRVQFPWRFLSTGSVMAALAVGCGVAALVELESKGWRRLVPLLALSALLVVDAAPYTGASSWIPPYEGVTHWALDPGADEQGPFELTHHPVPVQIPAGQGMVRVAELYLPPDVTETPIELGWIAYLEWTTPPYYRGMLGSQGPDYREAGISLVFAPRQEQPTVVDAKPYATLVTPSGEIDAGPFAREPGRIRLSVSAPADGTRLIVREQSFPGWVARVDGRVAPMATTALGLMELSLPLGDHDVRLEFE